MMTLNTDDFYQHNEEDIIVKSEIIDQGKDLPKFIRIVSFFGREGAMHYNAYFAFANKNYFELLRSLLYPSIGQPLDQKFRKILDTIYVDLCRENEDFCEPEVTYAKPSPSERDNDKEFPLWDEMFHENQLTPLGFSRDEDYYMIGFDWGHWKQRIDPEELNVLLEYSDRRYLMPSRYSAYELQTERFQDITLARVIRETNEWLKLANLIYKRIYPLYIDDLNS